MPRLHEPSASNYANGVPHIGGFNKARAESGGRGRGGGAGGGVDEDSRVTGATKTAIGMTWIGPRPHSGVPSLEGWEGRGLPGGVGGAGPPWMGSKEHETK